MNKPGSQSGSRERARLYRTEAVVLRRRDFGEADRLLTIYTPEHGKLRVIAKGVRRTKSRMAGHLEPFSLASLLIAQGRNLDIVTQAATIDPMRRLRSEEVRIAYAGYFADLLDALTPDGAENPRSFELLLLILRRLEAGADTFVTARFFELTLLNVLGFRPELQQCVTCGRILEPVVNGFIAEGGTLCRSCHDADPQSLAISVNALKVLRLFSRGDLAVADELWLGVDLRAEVERLLAIYLRNLLDRDLPSLAVLKTIDR